MTERLTERLLPPRVFSALLGAIAITAAAQAETAAGFDYDFRQFDNPSEESLTGQILTDPAAARSVSGRVSDNQGTPLRGVRLLGQCESETGADLQINVQTNEHGEFTRYLFVDEDLSCRLQSVDLPLGVQPVSEAFTLASSDSIRLDLILEKGDFIEVGVYLDGDPAVGGNVLYLQNNRELLIPVVNGVAAFSALSPGGRLYFIGKDAGFPADGRAGCKVVASHHVHAFSAAAVPFPVIAIDSSQLSTVVAEIYSPLVAPRLLLYRRELPAAGIIPAVKTADGQTAIFPCVMPGGYELELYSNGQLYKKVPIDISAGNDLLEVEL